MKKLLSIILAGALALTVASPVFAVVDTYVPTGHGYFDIDYRESGVAAGADLTAYTNSNSSEFNLVYDSSKGSSITAIEDPFMGTVAKVIGGGTDEPQFKIPKANYKNPTVFEGSNATNNWGTTIIEFSFKPVNHKSTFGYYNQSVWGGWVCLFNPNGTITVRGSTTTEPVFDTDGWNHVVIEQYPFWHNAARPKDAVANIWINGVKVKETSASAAHANMYNTSADAVWNSSIYFNKNVGEVHFSHFAKYDTVQAFYSASGAGNAAPVVTPDGNKVKLNGTELFYEDITTVDEFLAAAPVTNGTSALYAEFTEDGSIEELGAGDDLSSEGEYEAKYYVLTSVAGDLLTTYTVSGTEAPEIIFADAIKSAVDEATKTLTAGEGAYATVGELKALISGGGTTTIAIKNGDTVLEDTDALVNGLSIVGTTNGGVAETYTLKIRALVKYYKELDFSKYNPETDGTVTEYATAKGFKIDGRGSTVSLDAVMDEEMGHTVALWNVKSLANIPRLQVGNPTDRDAEAGDWIVYEAVIKPTVVNQARNPKFMIGNGPGSERAMLNMGEAAASNIITTYNICSGYMPTYEANKWYKVMVVYNANSGAAISYVNGKGITYNGTNIDTTGNNCTADKFNAGSFPGYVDYYSGNNYYIEKLAIYRTNTAYDPVAAGDFVSLKSNNETAVTVDTTTNSVKLNDTALTLEAVMETLNANGGKITFVDEDGVAIDNLTETLAIEAKKVVVMSKSCVDVKEFSIEFADLTSEVYEIASGKIKGVLPYTTPEEFLANVTDVLGGATLADPDAKYIADGAKFNTEMTEYTIELAAGYHNTGYLGNGFVFSQVSGATTAATTIEDALRGSNDVISISGRGGYTRLCFPGNNGGNLSSDHHIEIGDIETVEFSIKANGSIAGGLNINDNWAFRITEDGTMGTGFNSGAGTVTGPFAMKMPVDEWVHVAVSAKHVADEKLNDGSELKYMIYINGDLVWDGKGSNTDYHNNYIGLDFFSSRADSVIYIDDIKWYKSNLWGVDFDFAYPGFDAETNENVVVKDGEVWIADKTVVNNTFYTADGALVDFNAVADGTKVYVKDSTSTIVKPYVLRFGSIGVELDGSTIKANVGMIDDAAKPAMYVAGFDGIAFTFIQKVAKADPADDTIEYDLGSVSDSNVKAYVWDDSLTSLTDVAEFECVEGVWSAK